MADAADSKSVNGDIVRVQVPPPALKGMLGTVLNGVRTVLLLNGLYNITKN